MPIVLRIDTLPCTCLRRASPPREQVLSHTKRRITMSKVYLEVPLAPDRLIGHVKENGDVYRSDAGLDDKIGRVDLDSGRVYSRRLGPDKKVGHVNLENGKVYVSRVGPDDYIGRVKEDGSIRLDRFMGADDYIGRVAPFLSYAHSAAAMLLLVLPAIEAQTGDADSESPEVSE